MRMIYLALLILGMVYLSACQNENPSEETKIETKIETETSSLDTVAEIDERDVFEKGYNLPVNKEAGKRAEEECREVMEMTAEIYIAADKGDASDVVLSDEAMLRMKAVIKEKGQPVISSETYAAMENYEKMEKFLYDCSAGKKGSVVMYEVGYDGGIGRDEYVFDGIDMYVLETRAVWSEKNQPGIAYLSYTRIRQWEYTEKGWFCYERCVPEYPEVTEMVDGSCLIRVRPMTEKQRRMSERCVKGLGYQGNNLLCSNWDTTHMEELDYNGLYEYLYAMKHQEKFSSEDYRNGIPKEEFESLIMEYLPIKVEEIREYAAFDEENQIYFWAGLGCLNYAPNFFGTSLPEVTDIKENEDGTVTLRVEAVCEMVICNDAVIAHELTVRFMEDGSFRYLGNKILEDGVQDIPEYQYRIWK